MDEVVPYRDGKEACWVTCIDALYCRLRRWKGIRVSV